MVTARLQGNYSHQYPAAGEIYAMVNRFIENHRQLGITTEIGNRLLQSLVANSPCSFLHRRRLQGDLAALDGLFGESAAMIHLKDQLKKVAVRTERNVLITGPSGTGKSRMAKAIHFLSPRRAEPFRTFDCAGASRELYQSELFGHVKGAFTGATEERNSIFQEAGKGTVFLDEIGDVSAETQKSLLRLLDDNVVRKVGSSREEKIHCRIVYATNKDLTAKVEDTTFRQDLYYRLTHGAHIDSPSLHEREYDKCYLAVLLIMRWMLTESGGHPPKRPVRVERSFLDSVMGYTFPGNIRELEGIINRSMDFMDGNHLDGYDFHNALKGGIRAGQKTPSTTQGLQSVKSMQKRIERIENISINACPTIAQTLVSFNGDWFSPKSFRQKMLQCPEHKQLHHNTYGRYLALLKSAGILEHNLKKSNRSRFRLNGKAATPASLAVS